MTVICAARVASWSKPEMLVFPKRRTRVGRRRRMGCTDVKLV